MSKIGPTGAETHPSGNSDVVVIPNVRFVSFCLRVPATQPEYEYFYAFICWSLGNLYATIMSFIACPMV